MVAPTTSHSSTILHDTFMFIWSPTSLKHYDSFKVTWLRWRIDSTRVWKYSGLQWSWISIWLIQETVWGEGNHLTSNYSLHTALTWHGRECRNMILLDMVRFMIAQANLPISFRRDALFTSTYMLNRVPFNLVPSTPYELWTSDKPNLCLLRPWGSMAYVHASSHPNGKLGPREKKCIFIRYSKHSTGYVFLRQKEGGSVRYACIWYCTSWMRAHQVA